MNNLNKAFPHISRRNFLKGLTAFIPVLCFGKFVKSEPTKIIEQNSLEGMWSTNLGTAEPLSLESLEKAIAAIGDYQEENDVLLSIKPTYLIL
jgi:hypothetical protein